MQTDTGHLFLDQYILLLMVRNGGAGLACVGCLGVGCALQKKPRRNLMFPCTSQPVLLTLILISLLGAHFHNSSAWRATAVVTPWPVIVITWALILMLNRVYIPVHSRIALVAAPAAVVMYSRRGNPGQISIITHIYEAAVGS